MVPEDAYIDSWQSPFRKDPFELPLENQLALLLAADAEMRRVKGVTLTETGMQFRKIDSWFASSIGSRIHQTETDHRLRHRRHVFPRRRNSKALVSQQFWRTACTRRLRTRRVTRTFEARNTRRRRSRRPAFRGAVSGENRDTDSWWKPARLADPRIRRPSHRTGSRPGPGSEFRRHKFSHTRSAQKLRYGSDIVNVVADARLEHGPGLGSFAYDDEGVPAQCTDIIKDGQFRGYLSNRETAHLIGLKRSSRHHAHGELEPPPDHSNDKHQPQPGTWDFDDLIADTDDGILMETNRSWSIDDRRYQFQFSTELGWEIKGGKKRAC